MREPYSVRVHLNMIWGLVYNARLDDARKMFALLERKMHDGKLIIPEDSESESSGL